MDTFSIEKICQHIQRNQYTVEGTPGVYVLELEMAREEVNRINLKKQINVIHAVDVHFDHE